MDALGEIQLGGCRAVSAPCLQGCVLPAWLLLQGLQLGPPGCPQQEPQKENLCAGLFLVLESYAGRRGHSQADR